MKTIEATATETAIINSPDRRNTLLNFVRNFMKVGIDEKKSITAGKK